MKKREYILKLIIILMITFNCVKSYAAADDMIRFCCLSIDPLTGLIPQYELYNSKDGKWINGLQFNVNINYLNFKRTETEGDHFTFFQQFKIGYTTLFGEKDIIRFSYLPMIGFIINPNRDIIYIGFPAGYYKSYADMNRGFLYGVTLDYFWTRNSGISASYEKRYDSSHENSGYSIYFGYKFHFIKRNSDESF